MKEKFSLEMLSPNSLAKVQSGNISKHELVHRA